MIRAAESSGNRRAMHSHFGASPELRVLLLKLLNLASYPLNVVLVFDGPERPSCKRGKKVSSTPHWLTRQTGELATAFGFQVITVSSFFSLLAHLADKPMQAPGEAEAQLAALSMQGLVDIVLTNDIDCLIFGASLVMEMCVHIFAVYHPIFS